MSATDYTYDLRDLNFLLFEVLKAQDLCKLPAYKDFSKEDFEMVVDEALKFARDKLAPINRDGDVTGCQIVDGQVHVPPSFKTAFNAYREAGWSASNGGQAYGGQGLPHVVNCSLADIFTGANCSFFLYSLLLVGVAHVLEKYGSDWMKERIIPRLYAGDWGGTMVLTEPSAGSDVGAAKTKAVKVDGQDYYLVSGDKVIFITGGDQDLTENIIHLVLARTPKAPAGTKGLSLFVVPKYLFNTDGSLGGFNDVDCVRIEHKMGIKGSATCQLAFGGKGTCRGWLLGKEGEGMKIMFNMMNEARIEVGLQGTALANAAYLNARDYAKERLQGSSIKNFKNADAPRVPIIDHPDVRRQLLTMKAIGEGMRSILLYAAFCNDLGHHAATPEEREKYNGFLELLTPICKAYCTDRGVEMTSMAIQVYGGYGYTYDFPVEQYMRDCKIGCIYEGTNSIQAMDLMARKLGMKGGAVFMSYAAELDRVAEMARKHGQIANLADPFQKAKERLVEVAMNLGAWGMAGKLDLAASRAYNLLDLMGDVVLAAELLKAAAVAEDALKARLAGKVDWSDKAALAKHLADSEESAFYYGKIMNARFFVTMILPRSEASYQAALSEDTSHLDVVL